MNAKIKTLLLASVAVGFLAGCSTTPKPEPWDYTAFQECAPRTILVVMPTTQSNDIKAGPSCLASAVLPLAEAGYYPLPVTMVNDTFRYNGVTEAAEIHKVPVTKLKEVFGADAVMYIDVEQYTTNYQVVDSATKVMVAARLVDTTTERVLWQNRFFTTNADQSSAPNTPAGLIGKLIGAMIKHAINEAGDQAFPLAQRNARVLYTPGAIKPTPILAGPRSPDYQKDAILTKIKQDKEAAKKENTTKK